MFSRYSHCNCIQNLPVQLDFSLLGCFRKKGQPQQGTRERKLLRYHCLKSRDSQCTEINSNLLKE